MRKIFLLALLLCMLFIGAVAEAAQITDVKWGVDRNNVLRLVVDITDSAGYNVQLEGAKLRLTVNAKAAGQIPKLKKIKSTLADELRVVDGGSYTEIHLPLNQHITNSDYKAFVLKQDPKTGRPFRVVLDVTAGKTTSTSGTSTMKPASASVAASKAAASTNGSASSGSVVSSRPVVGSRPVKAAAAESNQPVVSKPATSSTVVTTKKLGSNAESSVAIPKAGTVVSTQKPGSEQVKSSVSLPSGKIATGKDNKDNKDDKDKNKDVEGKGSKVKVITTTTGKATTKAKVDEPIALKSKTKFRTGGGIKGKIITLDPGHGGSDPGAIGASGLKEKQITLEISMRVKELLEKEGAKVYMTRTTDVDVYGPNASDRAELQARVNVAEKHNSDLFLSLHINSSVNKNVGGFSSYYYPKTDNDLKIAKAIQDKFAKNFGVDNLGVRQANFYVVKRCSMPATLLEMCFISNAREEKLMKGKWFQKKTARLIMEGVKNYFD